jgi:hypothetical protein
MSHNGNSNSNSNSNSARHLRRNNGPFAIVIAATAAATTAEMAVKLVRRLRLTTPQGAERVLEEEEEEEEEEAESSLMTRTKPQSQETAA